MDELLQEITLYHKTSIGYTRYSLKASYRGTSILNRNKTGATSADNALIRIFYKDNDPFEVSKDDVIVNKLVTTEITNNAPLTELQKLHGKDNVFKVKSIDIFKFNDKEISELNHTKIGLV